MSATDFIDSQREEWFDCYDSLRLIFNKPAEIQEIGLIRSRMNGIASTINYIQLRNLKEVEICKK